MSGIDIASIKPGGKVSVTLLDGTKIIDSPVTERGGSLFCAQDSKRILDKSNPARCHSSTATLNPHIVSIDAYTPPSPAWAAAGVFAIEDRPDGDIWVRHLNNPDKWTCITTNGRHNPPEMSAICYSGWTTETLAEQYPDARAYARVPA